MIYTSYYGNRRLNLRDPHCVGISRSVPKGYQGRRLLLLAPEWPLITLAKDGRIDEYRQLWQKYLDTLDAVKIAAELGEDPILLCWEGPADFCHRYMTAAWLAAKLGQESGGWEWGPNHPSQDPGVAQLPLL